MHKNLTRSLLFCNALYLFYSTLIYNYFVWFQMFPFDLKCFQMFPFDLKCPKSLTQQLGWTWQNVGPSNDKAIYTIFHRKYRCSKTYEFSYSEQRLYARVRWLRLLWLLPIFPCEDLPSKWQAKFIINILNGLIKVPMTRNFTPNIYDCIVKIT